MRLDVYLVEHNYYESRSKAQDAIKNNKIKINGKIINKSSYHIDENCNLNINYETDNLASRGGKKLLDAINSFNIDLTNKIVLDIGASTGGFTDVCLQNNAKLVYAVDVGHGQLIDRLKNDPRVINLEGINCRYLDKKMFDEDINFICMDVSFISIKKICDNLLNILTNKNTEMVFLIKPQFEVGNNYINKNGIVKNKKIHIKLLNDMCYYFNNLGLNIINLKKSSTKGRDGNQEYLIYLTNNPLISNNKINIDKIVKE